MTSQNNLEIKGTLQAHPLAELLAEASSASLTGSLRLSHEKEKIVIYFNNGNPIFAVSNERRHRLFEILLQDNKISRDKLLEIPNFTNDLELSETLKTKGLFSKVEIDKIFTRQIEEMLKMAFDWKQGEWIFSPLMRVKEEIHFKIEFQKLSFVYSRNLSNESIVRRFKSFNESFGANPSANALNIDLLPQEAFVLSRFEKSFLKIDEIKVLSGLSDAVTLQVLYSLWLGGFLYRQNWNPAFSVRKISEINSAKLSLKKPEEELLQEEKPVIIKSAAPIPALSTPVKAEPIVEHSRGELSLEEYLQRAEESGSYYELLDIAPEANVSEMKNAYFGLARQFHPDKFYQEKDAALLQRIQNAFTKAAQAYETLKDETARKTYDYKLSKQPATLKEKEATDRSPASVKNYQVEMAKESFDEGFNLLMEDEFDDALPFLARAVQLAADNARYHAFYGKALSSDETQRFKADAEMQTAVRLEPQNTTFRIILAEFYIQFELFKRAEGELQRLLAIQPNHLEALALLDSLSKK